MSNKRTRHESPTSHIPSLLLAMPDGKSALSKVTDSSTLQTLKTRLEDLNSQISARLSSSSPVPHVTLCEMRKTGFVAPDSGLSSQVVDIRVAVGPRQHLLDVVISWERMGADSRVSVVMGHMWRWEENGLFSWRPKGCEGVYRACGIQDWTDFPDKQHLTPLRSLPPPSLAPLSPTHQLGLKHFAANLTRVVFSLLESDLAARSDSASTHTESEEEREHEASAGRKRKHREVWDWEMPVSADDVAVFLGLEEPKD